jgi:hypothetical protein
VRSTCRGLLLPHRHLPVNHLLERNRLTFSGSDVTHGQAL